MVASIVKGTSGSIGILSSLIMNEEKKEGGAVVVVKRVLCPGTSLFYKKIFIKSKWLRKHKKQLCVFLPVCFSTSFLASFSSALIDVHAATSLHPDPLRLYYLSSSPTATA